MRNILLPKDGTPCFTIDFTTYKPSPMRFHWESNDINCNLFYNGMIFTTKEKTQIAINKIMKALEETQ